MMAAFLKNGERVRVARNNHAKIYDVFIGRTGVIVDYSAFALQSLIQFDDGSFEYFWPSELERIEGESDVQSA